MIDTELPPTHFGTVIERRLLVGDHVYLVDERVHLGLKESGVTHVFDCMDIGESHELVAKPSYQSPWHVWNTRAFRTSDDGIPKPKWYWHDIIEEARFILSKPDTAIYVHCWAGLNRGPSATYAILRAVMGYSAAEAEELIRSVRPEVRLAYTSNVEEALKELRR